MEDLKNFSDGYGPFPDVHESDEDGLLAIGATLSLDRLIYAYQHGIFPWYNEGEPICWYAPPERFVLYPSAIKISKSMQAFMRRTHWSITRNKAFKQVMHACAEIERRGQDGTWINNQMINAYVKMHELGYAHSIEVWDGEALVGGLYGVEVGQVFCGESMFSHQSNASKMALISLCKAGAYELIDCQVYTSHLASLGAEMIDRTVFMEILKKIEKKNKKNLFD